MRNSNNNNGISFFTVLGLIFIALKLIGNITWSWWFVLMPLYLPLPLGLTIVIIYLTIKNKNAKS